MSIKAVKCANLDEHGYMANFQYREYLNNGKTSDEDDTSDDGEIHQIQGNDSEYESKEHYF